jgi:hypothetical protein
MRNIRLCLNCEVYPTFRFPAHIFALSQNLSNLAQLETFVDIFRVHRPTLGLVQVYPVRLKDFHIPHI